MISKHWATVKYISAGHVQLETLLEDGKNESEIVFIRDSANW